ncbi:MAG: molybdopterin oxidoreductase family protein [Chakrabartia sp.]
MATHHRTCHICEANCGIIVTTEGSRITAIKGDPDNPLSRGHICPKATALEDLQNDPDRLRVPQKRVGSDWQDISWDQAFAEIGAQTRAILAKDPAAAALYVGNPNAHNYANALNSQYLRQAIGVRSIYSASTVDQMPHQVVNLRLYGHSALWAIPDIDRTETLIVLGGNPMASNGSVWTVPDFRQRVKDLQARGGQLVVIDPRRSETARIADRHLFIQPGRDVFLLIALLKTVLAHPARPALPGYVTGLDMMTAALSRFDTAACSAACAVAPQDISWLADRLIARPAALYGRMGIATQTTGTLNAWLIALINIAAGQLDRAGGLVFPTAAIDMVATLGRGSIGRRQSRVSGHPEVLGEFPAAALAEEIETPGDGQIRALFVMAGNPVLSTPNGARLDRALAGLELMVSIDMYRTATSRRAHYILPPVGPLERDHYGMLLLPMAVRNIAKYSPPLFAPAPGALQDWEILRGLAGAISGQAVQAPPPSEVLDGLLRAGPYGVSLAEVAQHAAGMDFGPPQPGRLPERLQNADKTITCAPDDFLAALAGLALPEAPQDQKDGPLNLIGRRHVRTNNSWLANSPRLVKGPPRCTLLIHPDDARQRGLSDGDLAEVRSIAGMVRLPAEVSDEMMPGTVSIPHGWGHGLPGIGMTVAAAHAGVSVNDLTDESRIDPLSGNAGFSAVQVEVTAAG